MANGEVLVDGSMAWGQGVNSVIVPTIAGPSNPDGLPRDQNFWLVNCSDRDGGLSPRAGWQPMGLVTDGSALWQGGITYVPRVAGDPYLLCLVGGHVLKVTYSTPPTVTDLSVIWGVTLPANQVHAYFVQAEEFVVIQAGDLTTNPLFWDDVQLWQSAGGTAPYPALNELPPGGPMCYYQGRIWIAQWNGNHRTVNAGDIVGDQFSGDLNFHGQPTNFRNSVLRVTENPVAIGGDGFTVPAGPGDIRGLQYSANLDATLGQGTLFAFTRDQVYSLTVPISRKDWIAADANNQPHIQVVQLTNGSVNDRSIVQVNGDLFYQTITGNLASLSTALKYFQQWGNTPVSANEYHITSRQDRGLLQFVSGIEFNNRLLMGALPKQFRQGVACQAIIPMDFTPISSFGKGKPPAWQGHYEGLNFLQLFNANFGGLEKAFGIVIDDVDGSVKLWELTLQDQFENGDNRISWLIKGPSFDFRNSFALKKLVSLELTLDRLWGKVDFDVYFVPDQYPCPIKWASFSECAARNCQEDALLNAIELANCIYPQSIPDYREQYRATKVLPLPPDVGCNVATNRPFNVGFQFQIIIKVTGFCRIRGYLLKALPVEKDLYTGLILCQ